MMLRLLLSFLLIPVQLPKYVFEAQAAAEASEPCREQTHGQCLKCDEEAHDKRRRALLLSKEVVPVAPIVDIIEKYCGRGFSIKELLALGHSFPIKRVVLHPSTIPAYDGDDFPFGVKVGAGWQGVSMMQVPMAYVTCCLDLSGRRLSSLEGLDQIPDYETTTELRLNDNCFDTITLADIASISSLRLNTLSTDPKVAELIKRMRAEKQHQLTHAQLQMLDSVRWALVPR